MREILFKAKRKDNGEWIEGYPRRIPQAIQIGPYEPYWDMYVPPADPDDKGGIFGIYPETLCQYTGLKDKSGTTIFEGDIIRVEGIEEDISVSWSDKFASWRLDKQGWAFGHFFGESVGPEQCEVIKNIHDNT